MQQPGLRKKSDLHLSRKLWHCFGICMAAVLYTSFTIKLVWIFTLLLILAVVPLDIMRRSRPKLNKVIVKVFGPVMREHELDRASGFSYLLLGCIFLLLLNDRHVVTLTLLFLAFGDPIASFFGIRYGKDRIIGSKTLQGTIAAFVVCSVIAAVYFYANNLMVERLLIVAPVAGLIGALAELIPIGNLDDNLTFPVVASVMLWILFQVYGG